MIVRDKKTISIKNRADLVDSLKTLTAISESLSMSKIKSTQIKTAASELANNMLRYAGGGKVVIETLEHSSLWGIRAEFEDQGPGIENIELAMKKGYSSTKSLGHGLSGAKQLVDKFDLFSEKGKGTRVVITKWC